MKFPRAKLFYGILERPVPVRQYGSGNGAWNVVAGSLNQASCIVSVGVGNDISFDKAVLKEHSCRLFALDPTPTGMRTIEKHQPLPEGMSFHPIGLAAIDAIVAFDEPAPNGDASYHLSGGESTRKIEFPCQRLQTFMAEQNLIRVDLLKMDIEGFEYAVLYDIIRSRLDVRQICVEFHHDLVPGCTRWQTIRAVLRLRRAGFQLVNHDGLNHTFLRIKP